MASATITGPPVPQFRPPRRTGGAGGGGTVGPPGPAGPGVPAGGTAGQVLEKISSADYATAWSTPAAGAGGAAIGPTPPASPAVGGLWWRSDPDGRLFVWYDDGNSQQWVPATPTGVPALGYRHVQASAATTWAITHNLSFRPNVAAVDSTGQEIVPGAVQYPSATTVQLTFSAAVGGEAYLS